MIWLSGAPGEFCESIGDSTDYQPMIDAIRLYLRDTADKEGFDVGIGFVDIETGQVVAELGGMMYCVAQQQPAVE